VTADALTVTLGDRQAGSAVARLDRNSPDTRHDARLIHYVTQDAL
jgi:hypothetical protein